MILTLVLSSCLAGPIAASGQTDTGFVYDPIYLKHLTGARHPESPHRLTAIVKRLQETSLLPQLVSLEPRKKDVEEWIAAVHDQSYINHVRQLCKERAQELDTGDTSICPDSYEAACAAVSGVLAAVDAVMEGHVRNAFCAVRPPGHHATPTRGMGFCIFNNVAIAARYVQMRHHLERILIVDWDVHHGNGTQEAFYSDPTVMYFSTHQYPFYPGTGSKDEHGSGPGEGFTVNVPLQAGTSQEEFIRVYREVLRPRAAEFRPDFVLISAGFDAHRQDLLGSLQMTEEGYATLTRIVRDIARQACGGRLVSVLEGGYNLDALAKSVEAHIRVLMEPTGERND